MKIRAETFNRHMVESDLCAKVGRCALNNGGALRIVNQSFKTAIAVGWMRAKAVICDPSVKFAYPATQGFGVKLGDHYAG